MHTRHYSGKIPGYVRSNFSPVRLAGISPHYIGLFTNGSIDLKPRTTGGYGYVLNEPAVTLHNDIITLSDDELSRLLYITNDEIHYLRNLNPTPGSIIDFPQWFTQNQEKYKLDAVDKYKVAPSDELLEQFWRTQGWVESIISGVVTLNEKAIAKYRRDKTGREKKSAATAKNKSWHLYCIRWDTNGQIEFVHYLSNDRSSGIILRGASLSSVSTGTEYALKHNRAEIIQALADVTPNEIITLYAESMLSGFTSAREIIEAKH
jgi:hypothetical protein